MAWNAAEYPFIVLELLANFDLIKKPDSDESGGISLGVNSYLKYDAPDSDTAHHTNVRDFDGRYVAQREVHRHCVYMTKVAKRGLFFLFQDKNILTNVFYTINKRQIPQKRNRISATGVSTFQHKNMS